MDIIKAEVNGMAFFKLHEKYIFHSIFVGNRPELVLFFDQNLILENFSSYVKIMIKNINGDAPTFIDDVHIFYKKPTYENPKKIDKHYDLFIKFCEEYGGYFLVFFLHIFLFFHKN